MSDMNGRVRVGNGCVVSDEPLAGVPALDDEAAEYYGGKYLLCETISGESAERAVLAWNCCRYLSMNELRRLASTFRY